MSIAPAVRFEKVSKRYARGGARYSSLRSAIARAANHMRHGRPDANDSGPLALDRVSLEIADGESFGVIGPNGAGKTTMLKLISRISYPSEGRIRVRGRVSALIDVASGVHPELTGRENILLYGQILGMSRAAISRNFDRIVEFAELSDALDRAVKYYSAGMQLRLGFAVAAHLDPDIFVVDEALAVGDAGFQAKCIQRMRELHSEGKTIILVSHYLPAIEATCTRSIFMRDGGVQSLGETGQVLSDYLAWVESPSSVEGKSFDPRESTYLVVEDVAFLSGTGEQRAVFQTGDEITIRVRFRATTRLVRPHVSIGISDFRTSNLIYCSMLIDGAALPEATGSHTVSCTIPSLPLLPRVYEVRLAIETPEAFEYFDWQPVATFRIEHGPIRASGPASQSSLTVEGPVYVPHSWAWS